MAGNPASYKGKSYTYKLASRYGGPDEDVANLNFESAKVAADGKSVRLKIGNLRAGYVHEIHIAGLKSTGAEPLLHPEAYYTLVNIPGK